MTDDLLKNFTKDTFSPHIGELFQVSVDPATSLQLELCEVIGRGSEKEIGKREPFSLIFQGPAEPVFPQSIYVMEHGAIGTFSLFLVPIGPKGKGMLYEAVFT